MSNQEMLRRVAENNDALHRYSWTTRVEITEKAKKTVGLYKMRYDIDDQLQVTPMNSDAPAPESIEPGIQRLAKLASAYSQPGQHQLSRFLASAQIWEGRGNTAGTTRIEGTNLQVSGDRVTITLRGKNPERMEVDTSADVQPFHLTIEFRALPQDGPVYAARTVVSVPANQLDIRIENFDYITSAGGAVTTINLPPGTEVVVRSTQPLGSKQNRTGDVFNAIVDRAVVLDGRSIIPRGARAVGRVMEAA